MVTGGDFHSSESDVAWVLVHKGHMRTLILPIGGGVETLRAAGFSVHEIPAIGWESLLELSSGDSTTVSTTTALACQRCREGSATNRPRTGVGLWAGLVGEEAATQAATFMERQAGKTSTLPLRIACWSARTALTNGVGTS